MENEQKIKNDLQKLNIEPKKSFGQNFLNNDDLALEITQSLIKKSHNNLCEIGPGLGSLTNYLIDQRKLILIEKEQKLLSFLQKKYQKNENIVFVNQDILKIDFAKIFTDNKKYDVLGNLPYNIATKILRLFLWNYKYFENLYFSFPEEIAKKIISNPKNKSYGFLTVYCQFFAYCLPGTKIKKESFYPIPKIESQFIHFKIKSKIPESIKEEFIEFIKKCFKHKRKTLMNNFNKAYNLNEIKRKKIFQFLKVNSLLETSRAEELNLNQFLALFKIVNL